MNILCTPDCDNWAIARLTKAIVDNNPRFNFFNISVHPRAVAQGFMEIKKIMREGIEFDLYQPRYWHATDQLMELMPELKDIPKVLTHHNHNDLTKRNWEEYDTLTVSTNYGFDKLKNIHSSVYKIPYGIDLDYYGFNDNYPPKEKAVGYVGRIVPWKHLKEICEVSSKLKYKVVGCGYIDKPDYWATIPKDNLEYHGGMGRNNQNPENFVAGMYNKMTVFVMYSTSERESGTLPLLEAMAKGVPVMATSQGMARDLIEDGKNGIIFTEDNFEEKLKMLMEDKELREKLRQNAWNTIKAYSEQRMAREFARVYYKTLFKDKPVVSVIIPTFNNAKNLIDIVISIDSQDYDAKEIIIVDDGSTDNTKEACEELRRQITTPILYLDTKDTNHYGLAKARNMGATEALGSVLLFLDDRLKLDKGVLEEVSKAKSGTWYFGSKSVKGKVSDKSSFVENFSWIQKKDFVMGGMFCERMVHYGGLSQITREQYNHKVKFVHQPKAIASQIKKSSGRYRKKDIWKAKEIINKLYE